jgi:integrase
VPGGSICASFALSSDQRALGLRWRDVNLNGRCLRVTASKTDTGVREVDLTPALQELLAAYRSRSPYAKPGDLVFPTSEGKRDNPSNVRNRFLASAARLANADLRAAGREPMPDVTPHSLRRTFISLLLAAGADVPYVMAQAGHSDPKMNPGPLRPSHRLGDRPRRCSRWNRCRL